LHELLCLKLQYGKINVYDKIVIEKQKKTRYGTQRIFFLHYINIYLKDGLGIEFTACQGELMPEAALTSFNDACRYFAGQALLMTSQNQVTHIIFNTNGL